MWSSPTSTNWLAAIRVAQELGPGAGEFVASYANVWLLRAISSATRGRGFLRGRRHRGKRHGEQGNTQHDFSPVRSGCSFGRVHERPRRALQRCAITPRRYASFVPPTSRRGSSRPMPRSTWRDDLDAKTSRAVVEQHRPLAVNIQKTQCGPCAAFSAASSDQHARRSFRIPSGSPRAASRLRPALGIDHPSRDLPNTHGTSPAGRVRRLPC